MNAQLHRQLTPVTRRFGRASNGGGGRPENPNVTGRPLVTGPLVIERRGSWLVASRK
jgi:hypothetical protein